MALTRLPKKGLTDNSVDSSKIEDGTVRNLEISGTLNQDRLATSTIANDKLSNSSFTLNGSSVSLGGTISASAGVEWQSVVTADGSTFNTAVANEGYLIDTSSAAHTINLPSSASLGDTIAIKDYAESFGTNNLTIGRNGHNIQGSSVNSVLSTNRASVVLVYVDATKGWLFTDEHNVADLQEILYVTATGGTITTSGDFKIHTFNSSSTFVVSCGGNASGSNAVDYLVIAGGGGGMRAGGGGGAGGYRESKSPVAGTYTASPLAATSNIPVSAQTYPVTVGAGGSGGSGPGHPCSHGSKGSDSVFSTITSAGGGGGGNGCVPAPYPNPFGPPPNSGVYWGEPGGSGSGAIKFYNALGTAEGGNGNTPPVSPPQGNDGGDCPGPGGGSGSGGGGAGTAGSNVPASNVAPGGNGGNGTASAITGSSVTRAGGGGGGGRSDGAPNPNQSGGSAGPGGGGAGGQSKPSTAGSSGTANTGGGGGGGGVRDGDQSNGGAGGSGIVIIRYKYQ